MKPGVMRNGAVVSTLLVILVMAMGCASLEAARHKYLMRGQVLEVQDGTAYLCIGSEEGAKVGQVFTVIRYVNMGFQRGIQPSYGGLGPYYGGVQPYYRIDRVGMVKITAIETHMAHAKIVSGDVKANDIVELNIDNP